MTYYMKLIALAGDGDGARREIAEATRFMRHGADR
jgi:hypothetical protein